MERHYVKPGRCVTGLAIPPSRRPPLTGGCLSQVAGIFPASLIFLSLHIFENALKKKTCFHEAVLKRNPVYTNTLENTENDVVPMSSLAWRRKFTP